MVYFPFIDLHSPLSPPALHRLSNGRYFDSFWYLHTTHTYIHIYTYCFISLEEFNCIRRITVTVISFTALYCRFWLADWMAGVYTYNLIYTYSCNIISINHKWLPHTHTNTHTYEPASAKLEPIVYFRCLLFFLFFSSFIFIFIADAWVGYCLPCEWPIYKIFQRVLSAQHVYWR